MILIVLRSALSWMTAKHAAKINSLMIRPKHIWFLSVVMPSTELLWVAALAAGFLGSPHCLGMCGGIVTAFGMSLAVSSAPHSGGVLTLHLSCRVVC
jgi:hypothetical protein